jgi:hypothetical protein
MSFFKKNSLKTIFVQFSKLAMSILGHGCIFMDAFFRQFLGLIMLYFMPNFRKIR